jgi:hypothetical protein
MHCVQHAFVECYIQVEVLHLRHQLQLRAHVANIIWGERKLCGNTVVHWTYICASFCDKWAVTLVPTKCAQFKKSRHINNGF